VNRTHRPWFRATCLILSYLLYFDLLASSALQWVERRGFSGADASASASASPEEPSAPERVAEASRTIFVSATDPTCGGRSPCFAQIQKAIDAAIPGDHIVVFPGLYPERLRIIEKNRHAAASEADRIKLYADPLAPVGSVVVGPAEDQPCSLRPALEVLRSKFVTIEGFDFRDAGARGVVLRGEGGTNQGIHVLRNRIHGERDVRCSGGVTVWQGNADAVIANNLIYANRGEGIPALLGRVWVEGGP